MSIFRASQIESLVKIATLQDDIYRSETETGTRGDCRGNVTRLLKQLSPKELRRISVLGIWDMRSRDNGCLQYFHANPGYLRPEEKKTLHSPGFMGYHFVIQTRDREVFDLSAEKAYWGQPATTYLKGLFGPEITKNPDAITYLGVVQVPAADYLNIDYPLPLSLGRTYPTETLGQFIERGRASRGLRRLTRPFR